MWVELDQVWWHPHPHLEVWLENVVWMEYFGYQDLTPLLAVVGNEYFDCQHLIDYCCKEHRKKGKIVVNLVEIIRIRYRDHYGRMIVGIEFCVILKVDDSLLILLFLLALDVLVLMMMMLLLLLMVVMMMMNLEFPSWSFVLS